MTPRTCMRCGADFERVLRESLCLNCRRPRPRLVVRRGPLSPRELQIIELIAQGRQNREVAAQLKLAKGTVSSYLVHIYQVLHVRNRTELAVQYALGDRLSRAMTGT